MGTPAFGFGARFLLDQQQRFYKQGLPVYLRVMNSDETDSSQDFLEMGFEVTVTGAIASGGGVKDILISPQPMVKSLSQHDIGISGGKLLFGATKFRISHSFVIAQMSLNGYTDDEMVFRDPKKVLGLIYDNRLYSIESSTTEAVGGETIFWDLICNTHEIPTVTVSP